jgi:hypothetical protein
MGTGARSSMVMQRCRRQPGSPILAFIIQPIATRAKIVVVFDTKDAKNAKTFAASDDLKKAMGEASVLDTPTVYFLESID